MRTTRLHHLLIAISWASLAASPASEPEAHLQPGATGARPPTREEQAWIDEHAILVEAVHPNALAVQRLHAERRRRGLAVTMPAAVAIAGREFSGRSRTSARTSEAALIRTSPFINGKAMTVGQLAATASTALPHAVDNSQERWFPPIGNQGKLGSCALFSVGYYQLSYHIAKDLDRDISDASAPDHTTRIFSPRFLVNMSTTGKDGSGSPFGTLMDVGCTTWATIPYTDAQDRLSSGRLPTTAVVWREAMRARILGLRTVPPQHFKQELANGNLLNFITNIAGWGTFGTIGRSSDPRVNNSLAGQRIMSSPRTAQDDLHAMTLVGYDDGVWVDLDGDGVVEDNELGAYKVANQWGRGWGNKGFMWVAYAHAGVLGYGTAITTAGLLQPKAVAEISVITAQRGHFVPRFGVGTTHAQSPVAWRFNQKPYFTPSRADGSPTPFDGGTVASQATIAFDISDLITPGIPQRFFLQADDMKRGDPLAITRFVITDSDGNLLAPMAGASAAGGLPHTIDSGSVTLWADVTVGTPTSNVPAITSPARFTCVVGQPCFIPLQATNGPIRFAVGSLPPGLQFAETAIVGNPLAVGTHRVAILASNHVGAGSAQLELTVTSKGTDVPAISSANRIDVVIGSLSPVIHTLTVAGASDGISFGAVGLPSGFILDASKGTIRYFGTGPSAGVYPVTFFVLRSGHVRSQAAILTVIPPATTGAPSLIRGARVAMRG